MANSKSSVGRVKSANGKVKKRLVLYDYQNAFGFATDKQLYIAGIRQFTDRLHRKQKNILYEVFETGSGVLQNYDSFSSLGEFDKFDDARKLIIDRAKSKAAETAGIEGLDFSDTPGFTRTARPSELFVYDYRDSLGFAAGSLIYLAGLKKKIIIDGEISYPTHYLVHTGSEFLRQDLNPVAIFGQIDDYNQAIRKIIAVVTRKAEETAKASNLRFDKAEVRQKLLDNRGYRSPGLVASV